LDAIKIIDNQPIGDNKIVVFRRAEKKSNQEQKRTIVSVIQYLKRELGMTNCVVYPEIINTEDDTLPSEDLYDPRETEISTETEL
jgi:hypothetical protein